MTNCKACRNKKSAQRTRVLLRIWVAALGGCRGAADAEVGDGAVDLGLLPPLLQLLLAPHCRKLVQLLDAVVVHHTVPRRPRVQVHRDAPEVLRSSQHRDFAGPAKRTILLMHSNLHLYTKKSSELCPHAALQCPAMKSARCKKRRIRARQIEE